MDRRSSLVSRNHRPDPDNIFAGTRMSFGDHLEELRVYLWRALAGFALILAGVFALDGVGLATNTPIGVGKPMMDWIAQPVEAELQAFYDRRAEKRLRELQDLLTTQTKEIQLDLDVHELAQTLAPLLEVDLKPSSVPARPRYVPFHGRIPAHHWYPVLSEAQRLLGPRPSLKTFSVAEAMIVYFKVALVSGLVLGSPWIFWQVWSFVAVGLYPHERKFVHVYLPFSLGLFLAGVFVCQFLVMPKAVEAMLWFNEWLNLEPDLRLSEWLGFAIWMPVVFGLSFQLPLVMLFVERLGILEVSDFQGKRRLAWFLMAIFAAVVTPSIDLLSLFFLWLPLGLLYELGILLCRLAPRAEEETQAEWDGLVE